MPNFGNTFPDIARCISYTLKPFKILKVYSINSIADFKCMYYTRTCLCELCRLFGAQCATLEALFRIELDYPNFGNTFPDIARCISYTLKPFKILKVYSINSIADFKCMYYTRTCLCELCRLFGAQCATLAALFRIELDYAKLRKHIS